MSKRWSYNVVELKPGWTGTVKPKDMQDELTRQGLQGWELVSVTTNALMTVTLVFKKES